MERTNVRELAAGALDPPADLCVADLSFISLRTVAPNLLALTTPDAEFVLLVKPQFEAGRARVGQGGIVRDPDVHAAVLREVVDRSRREPASACRPSCPRRCAAPTATSSSSRTRARGPARVGPAELADVVRARTARRGRRRDRRVDARCRPRAAPRSRGRARARAARGRVVRDHDVEVRVPARPRGRLGPGRVRRRRRRSSRRSRPRDLARRRRHDAARGRTSCTPRPCRSSASTSGSSAT